MIILLNETLRISKNRHCWQLSHRLTIDGVKVFVPYRYFTSLLLVLLAAGEEEVLVKAKTLNEAADAFARIARRYELAFDCAYRKAA